MKSTITAIVFSILIVGIAGCVFFGMGKTDKVQAAAPAGDTSGKCLSFYHKSLHATGEGMRFMYEAKDGLMQLTGIPYKDLNCKSCHADSCDKCHAEEKDGKFTFSTKMAKDDKTCLKCHKRHGATAKFDKKAGFCDIHCEADVKCVDCHKAVDVHGDGTVYDNMRVTGAVKAKCTNCHDEKEMADKNRSHKLHMKDLACQACHTSQTMACYNCHFDEFLRQKTRAGNFIPSKDWLLLVNYKGKITTGNAQTFVSKGKKFVTYVPYHTHSIRPQGRNCGDCHGIETVKKQHAGGKVRMADFKDGKLIPVKGVVPLVEGGLEWPFLDKKDGKWILMEGTKPDLIQYGNEAKPLTKEQLDKLAKPQK